jgi:hypothetical protein
LRCTFGGRCRIEYFNELSHNLWLHLPALHCAVLYPHDLWDPSK